MSTLFIKLIRASSFRSLLQLFGLPAMFLALFSMPMLASAEGGYAKGFQLNRYEPTTPGEFSFSVDHPWFKSTQNFAVGFNFDTAIQPWTSRSPLGDKKVLLDYSVVGHFMMAWSPHNRLNIAVSWPFTFGQAGDTTGTGIVPAGPIAVGDPRLSIFIRAYNDPYLNFGSFSVGVDAWIPFGKFIHGTTTRGSETFATSIPQQIGDSTIRLKPKLIFGGIIGPRPGHGLLWSANIGFLYQTSAKLGTAAPTSDNTIDSQLELNAAIGYANLGKRLYLGAELNFSTWIFSHQFEAGYRALEVTPLALHVKMWENKKGWVATLNAAASFGTLLIPQNAVGIPQARVVVGITMEHFMKPTISAPPVGVRPLGPPRYGYNGPFQGGPLSGGFGPPYYAAAQPANYVVQPTWQQPAPVTYGPPPVNVYVQQPQPALGQPQYQQPPAGYAPAGYAPYGQPDADGQPGAGPEQPQYPEYPEYPTPPNPAEPTYQPPQLPGADQQLPPPPFYVEPQPQPAVAASGDVSADLNNNPAYPQYPLDPDVVHSENYRFEHPETSADVID